MPKIIYEDQAIFRSRVLLGDCRKVLERFSQDTFTTCVTDPPYELQFMGKKWDGQGVSFQPETWEAVLRVLKPGGMLLAFGGTRTHHRLMCAIEDAGFEIRDCCMFLYGSGFPKSYNISKAIDKAAGVEREVVGKLANPCGTPGDVMQTGLCGNGTITAPATEAAKLWDGWGTALKPAWEPIVVAMKPLDGTFAENTLKHGVGGINVDGCRIVAGEDHKKNCNRSGGKRSGFMVSELEAEAHPSGRWPANLILDKEAGAMVDKQSNGASRFFYTAKASKKERTCDGQVVCKHPTVKPLALMEYLIRLVTMPEHNFILDPFCGSGSTLIACKRLGLKYVGIDSDPESVQVTNERLERENSEV